MSKFLSKFKKKSDIKDKKQNLELKPISITFMRLSLGNRIFFIKQLAILMKSGIPLFSSLKMLKQNSKSRTMVKIINQIIKDVENGQYLSTTLSRFRKIFGELTINIISIGEISGNLSDNLDHLVLNLKKQQSLKRKIINASVYPIFIVIATILITIMLTVFFFPKIIPVLKSVNYQLPWTTRFLIYISDLIKNQGLYILLGTIILIISVFLLLKIKKIHLFFDKILLSLPLLKKLIQIYNVSKICRTLGLLQKSGVNIVKSFQITSNTTTNLAYKKELNKIAEELIKGEKISTQINLNQKLFPAVMCQMIAVGESTGNLSDTFIYLSDVYEDEMDDIIKNLSTTVEPLLLVFMGVLVGFIAISIITPIYGITQNLKPR